MDTLLEKAINAYHRKCKREGGIFSQPSLSMSEVGEKFIYLNNINGLVAKYNMQTQRFVK